LAQVGTVDLAQFILISTMLNTVHTFDFPLGEQWMGGGGSESSGCWSLDCLVVWLFGRLVGCLFVWSAASLSRCPCSCPRGPQAAALLVRILLCTLTRWLFPPSCPVVVRAQYDPVNTSDPGHTFSTSVSLCFHPLVFIASHLLLCLLLHVLVFVRLLLVLVFGRVFCHDSVFRRLRSPVLSRHQNYRL